MYEKLRVEEPEPGKGINAAEGRKEASIVLTVPKTAGVLILHPEAHVQRC
jgi:hypothetical protein